MKKLLAVIMLIGCMLLTGCSRINYDITASSVAINGSNENTYYNPNDETDAYAYIEINGRKYLPYGTQKGTITGDMIGECIAYDENDDNQRFYKVIGDKNFLAGYYVIGEMEQFFFWRAEDTIGKDIHIPDFIAPLDYDIWN